MKMCDLSVTRLWPILSSVAHPVSEPQSPPRSMVIEQGKVFGHTCFTPGYVPEQLGLSWSSPLETQNGKKRSLSAFPRLAATSPNLSSALATLVRLIFAGECTLLPAPACRDWRSPGLRSHQRLKQSRGQQMPEVIGTRISSQLYRWMLGLPASSTVALEAGHAEE